MKKIIKKQQIFFLILSLLLVIVIYLWIFIATQKNNEDNLVIQPISNIENINNISGEKKTKPTTEIIEKIPIKKTISVEIQIGETIVALSPQEGSTLFDALSQARDDGKISFSGMQYPLLGFFVSDIGTLHQGNGKYLMYFINNIEASVGVSGYVLKDGDIISWKLK